MGVGHGDGGECPNKIELLVNSGGWGDFTVIGEE
ncbi:MAG: hypothetical protein RLZZ458_2663 [Planctomycetota bacterium]